MTEFDKIVARGMPIGSANFTTENRRERERVRESVYVCVWGTKEGKSK